MKGRFFFITVLVLVAYMLSACGGALQPAGESSGDQAALKVRAVEVAFTGVVEAMNGNEWTVNGQVLSVDPAVVRDGPFQVGDTIKVEGTVNADGSLSISRVEVPSAADLTTLPQLGNDNANANSNDANSNDANANSNANSNDANDNDTNTNANGNANDDDSNNVNSNLNDNDDNGNSNDNGDDDDDDSGGGNGNGDDSDDDDSGGNSNDDD